MRCETVLPLLDDFADRSVPLATAWRVRRHIKNCALCQKTWADAQAFAQEARGLYTTNRATPSPALRTRTLQAAPAAVMPAPAALRRRSLAGIGIAACGGAAATVAAIVALLWVTPRTPVRPTIAFAQVDAHCDNVNCKPSATLSGIEITSHFLRSVTAKQSTGVSPGFSIRYNTSEW